MRITLLLSLVLLFACKSPNTTSEAETTTIPEAKYSVTLNIEGMTCEGCENTIESSLGNLEGVVNVDASHEKANAIVGLNAESIDSALVSQAISEAGYTLLSISEN